MLKEIVLPPIDMKKFSDQPIDSNLIIMSHDFNVNELVIPFYEGNDFDTYEAFYTFQGNTSIIVQEVYNHNNEIRIPIVNDVRRHKGIFTIELNASSVSSQATLLKLNVMVKRSNIDSNSEFLFNHYYKLFEDYEKEIAELNNATQSTIKTQLKQSQDNLQKVTKTLIAINDKVMVVNDTAEDFMVDVATKQADVTSKYNAFDTSVTQANQTITNILALQNDVNTLKNEAPVTNDRLVDLENRAIKQYGVRRTLNATSPLLERIGDSAGKIASVPLDDSVVQNDFDNIYPWSHIKEVIIDSEGLVHYKGEPTYETAIGDWMIEVPLYYAKDVRTETYHDEYVSAFKLPGYYTPKDFIREDGTVCQKVYYGRFKTSKEGNLDVSRPHELPSNYRHLASFRDGAKAKGDGWQEIGIDYVCDFLQRLYKIEFANLNSQAILGSGITSVRYVATDVAILSETATNRFVTTPTIASNFRVGNVVNIGTILGENNVASMRAITAINDIDATQAEILFDGVPVNIAVDHIIVMVAQKTGQTTHLNQPSGKLSGVSGRTSIKWRGLEDPFGNLHEWIDGVLIVDNVGHLCDEPSKFSSALTSDYAPVNYVNANTNGYPLELGFGNNYPSVKFPILTGAGTTTGYADYYYQTTGLRGAFLGGHAASGSNAGLFFWVLLHAPSNSNWTVGGRLLFKPPV